MSSSDSQALAGPSVPLPPPAPPRAQPLRLVATLAVAGALAGVLLVVAFQATQPRILANKEARLAAAVEEVLHEPARFDTLYVVDGALVDRPPPGSRPEGLERAHVGYDAEGRRCGFALVAARPGYQDTVRLMFGWDPSAGALLGLRVLESKETPGLGDKIENDPAFAARFVGAEAPLVAVKPGKGSGTDPHEVDTITGATISSRTVIAAVNEAVARYAPLLDAWSASAAAAPPAPAGPGAEPPAPSPEDPR